MLWLVMISLPFFPVVLVALSCEDAADAFASFAAVSFADICAGPDADALANGLYPIASCIIFFEEIFSAALTIKDGLS